MTPPDEGDEAEIYVEVCSTVDSLHKVMTMFVADSLTSVVQGKKKMVDGFIRWCQKGDVGLSQQASVTDISEEEPTGLYDGFYVKTH